MDKVREKVREVYGKIATAGAGGSDCCAPSCCSEAEPAPADGISRTLGYSDAEMAGVPEGANLGLGCGNPQAIAALEPGETVLDLGSGGGFDCFLAAKAVGETGSVIGVDMTPEMIARARGNAARAGVPNVDFRLGEIEHVPVADGSVDVIISNCVINLSPDKAAVFSEAFRVLTPGGRPAVSDVVAPVELPPEVRNDLELHAGCVAGAATIEDLEGLLTRAGFVDVRIRPQDHSREFIREWIPGARVDGYIVSAKIEATRP